MIEIDLIVHWFWYFIKYYGNFEEVDLAMRLMNYYLNGEQGDHYGEISEDLRIDIS